MIIGEVHAQIEFSKYNSGELWFVSEFYSKEKGRSREAEKRRRREGERKIEKERSIEQTE